MKLRLILFFLSVVNLMNSAPDLIISGTSVTNTSSIYVYDKLKVITNVKNIGNTSCGSSFLRIYLSKDNIFSSGEEIGLISVPALAVNGVAASNFVYTIPNTTPAGNYYVGYAVDASQIITESNESNLFYTANPVNISSLRLIGLKIPYPIIFIHGLNSISSTWNKTTDMYDSLLGYRYGGRMDFSLNYDNNIYTANLATDYHDFTQSLNQTNLTAGDYYYVNFNVDPSGNYNVDSYTFQSNQSAIYKQGVAVRDAIKHVLSVTGASKVILVVHSMGGLASRTYLSNSNLWQSDNQHHVAKLFTIGTPHGGSNSSAGLLNALTGIDSDSEACRDLRYPSSPLNFYGKFLFGGTEDAVNNGGFNNDDINCNGIVGNAITGLNSKTVPVDISYACMFATGSSLGGDGIVDDTRANINNYGLTNNIPTVYADTIIDDEFVFTQNHTDLVNKYNTIIRGMDEADYINKAYRIQKNVLIQSLVNIHSNPASNVYDFDYFSFNQPSSGMVYFDFLSILQPSFKAVIYNSSYQVVATYLGNQNGSISQSLTLSAGTYYIEVSAAHAGVSWKYPYYIYVGNSSYFNASTVTDVAQINANTENSIELKLFPNPASEYIDLSVILSKQENNARIVISDMMGKELLNENLEKNITSFEKRIDVSGFETGIYFVTFVSDISRSTKKITIIK